MEWRRRAPIMLAMVPAMVAMTLVITLVIVFANRPTHHSTAALAENMARYHNIALDYVKGLTPDVSTAPRLLTDPPQPLGALKSIAAWRSDIIETAGRRYVVTYPDDYPASNARFDSRDFAEIPFVLRRNDYTNAIYATWSDSIGVSRTVDITGAFLHSRGTNIVDALVDLTPVLVTRFE
jgi:hypothetical protein